MFGIEGLSIDHVLGVVALIVGTIFARKVRQPTEQQRAELLARIAADSAALVVSLYPRAPWAELLKRTVQAVGSAAGLPVRNGSAIERAAAGALSKIAPPVAGQ